MDDILAYTCGSEENHWKTVRNILAKLDKAGLYLDIDKCQFLCQEVKYLGFVIKAGKSVSTDPEKIKAINEWKAPTSVKGVRSFLGFANFYRCFIDRFSELAPPLIDLTKKISLWKWVERENEAFKKFKSVVRTRKFPAQF